MKPPSPLDSSGYRVRASSSAKPPRAVTVSLPSLEALDRVNVVTTAVGFALLTLGILTGMIWLPEDEGKVWMGTTHEAWMVFSWAIHAGLVGACFAGRQGPRVGGG